MHVPRSQRLPDPRLPKAPFRTGRGGLFLVLLVGCSLFRSKPTPPPTRETLGTFHALSDSETATDFAATDSQVWVGTSRGLLRYDEGVENPVRLRTTDGLPGDEILALGANSQDCWVATNGGLARLAGGMVEPHISDYPFVGRIRALTLEPDGRLWVGGSQGVARFSGGQWSKWTERYDVMEIAVDDDDGAWIATQANGLALLKDNILYEHGISGGLPAPFVRNVVPLDDGEALVLAQSSEGAAVGYWHEGRWYSYTLRTRERLVALVEVDGQPTLVTPTKALRLLVGQVPDDVPRLIVAAEGPESEPRQFRVSAAESAGEPGPMPDAPRAAGPVRPIPPPAESADGPEIGYRERPLAANAPVVDARGAGEQLLVGTVGLGVFGLRGDAQTIYRTRDLVLVDRPFTVATDSRGYSYILTNEGRAAQFDGERLLIVDVTDDPAMQVVAFATGGTGPTMTAYALAHAPNTDWWRIYERRGESWGMLLDRQLQTADGVEDVTFFGVDPSGDFWLGLKVEIGERIAERGVAVLSKNRPDVVYHHSMADPERDGAGAKRIPDSLSAVAFEPEGAVWFAGLDGAVRLTADEVKTFGEGQGLQGGVVGDLDIGPGGVPYVATHAGVGRFEGSRWLFDQDRRVAESHPIAIAVDGDARIWSGGQNGVLVGVDGTWRSVGRDEGLLAEEVTSIQVDGANRIWFVTPAGISLLTME